MRSALWRRRILGHPGYVWLLWAVAATVLATCPMMLSDPGLWPYLLDPELLALVVVIGLQYTCLQLSWWRWRLLARWPSVESGADHDAGLDILGAEDAGR